MPLRINATCEFGNREANGLESKSRVRDTIKGSRSAKQLLGWISPSQLPLQPLPYALLLPPRCEPVLAFTCALVHASCSHAEQRPSVPLAAKPQPSAQREHSPSAPVTTVALAAAPAPRVLRAAPAPTLLTLPSPSPPLALAATAALSLPPLSSCLAQTPPSPTSLASRRWRSDRGLSGAGEDA